eukprot:CAMPEP_0183318464 /NCGR_PEP_ID=MMETSP0160_2-20130417/60809_1 /TAXON_ID=2839 ORGANISM="Odontella Sinensis, Strain Grunow 1884" /NCGR_SAMPLE_ID=MMETSP0160_2 /ASSEMBLY_ACC=CAM_ASM_000250 /LENGTH=85 /DNA_ID=CAMNT_0025484741 /DNA_START=791 /DNA_END=1048 /DNA_ORIENTATION=-
MRPMPRLPPVTRTFLPATEKREEAAERALTADMAACGRRAESRTGEGARRRRVAADKGRGTGVAALRPAQPGSGDSGERVLGTKV